MTSLRTCLWFDGTAQQAAAFYATVFPDVQIEGEQGPTDGMIEAGVAQADQPITVNFSIGDHQFIGLNGGPMFSFTEAISFEIACADQAEVDHYWSALTADGGAESQCGWCKDKFGVSWQVVPTRLNDLLADSDAGRADRAMKAMLGMQKIDIAALERAADGA